MVLISDQSLQIVGISILNKVNVLMHMEVVHAGTALTNNFSLPLTADYGYVLIVGVFIAF